MILEYCAVSSDTFGRTHLHPMDDKCELIHQVLESSPWSIGEQVQVMSCRISERDLDDNRLERW